MPRAVLAFLSMAQQRLGQKDKAAEYLNRLREVMKADRWAKDEEAQNFLREAEQLISKRTEAQKK